MTNIDVFYEATPNPQALKFVTTTIMTSESVNFTDAQAATRSPLAHKIFSFPWAAGVFIGPNFVTVTKQEWVEWEILADPLSELIKEHLESEQPVILALPSQEASDTEDNPNDTPVIREIKKILREEIRPAVAMDGGDITFDRYDEGRVYLQMKGSCSGCPSSMYTLKEGIETRLKERIPEIQEVVAV